MRLELFLDQLQAVDFIGFFPIKKLACRLQYLIHPGQIRTAPTEQA
jgi:hypothetical protein